MGARDKLNAVVIWGCLIASALLGAVMDSWWAFWGSLAVTLVACSSVGGIRTQPDARPTRTGRGAGSGRLAARGRRS